jgi:hypothetical protein
MIFFLFFSFVLSIRGDCLEFNNTSLINKCLIVDSESPDLNTEHYYPQCLLCNIETLIKPENIQLEQTNQCWDIELQCIQLKFPSIEIFEDFFRFHQAFLDDLFYIANGTDQNTLHVIIKNNTLHEINADYIDEIFPLNHRVYRALFFELHIHNEIIRIHRNLIDLDRLSIKLILVCDDQFKRQQTIYVFHDRNITRESKHDPCAPILIPSTTIIISTHPNQPLSISKEKSKNIVLIIILLTTFLFCLCITLMIYCWKRIRRLSEKYDTTSEVSVSQDETPLTPSEQPRLSLKLKRPLRGMRALQLLDDDV